MSVRWDSPCEPARGVWPTRLGAGPERLTRVQARGRRWRNVGRGLYIPTDTPDSIDQRIVEAAARLPGYGAVGGWAAAYWRGLHWLDGSQSDRHDPIVLNVGPGGRIRQAEGLTVLQTRMQAADIERVDGLWITSPVRTTFDGARRARSLTEAVVFVDQMLAAGLVTAEAVMSYAAANRAAWKGVGQVRDACRLSDPAAASPMESRARVVWMLNAQLPRPLVNVPVFTLNEELVGIVDLLDPDAGVVGEYDGEHHRGLPEHTSDNVREEWLEQLGLVVVRMTSLDIRTPYETAARLMAAWDRGEGRDRRRDGWTLQRPGWYRARRIPAALAHPSQVGSLRSARFDAG